MFVKTGSKNILFRILYSFVPPNLASKPDLEVDFVGAIFAVLVLAAILEYAHAFKTQFIETTPALAVVLFVSVVSVLSYVLLRVEKCQVQFGQVLTLICSSLYSHVITLAVAMFASHDDVNAVFYCCGVVLAGASCMRLVIVFILLVRRPVIHLVLSSVVCTGHMLFLLFSYFGYVHRTFRPHK